MLRKYSTHSKIILTIHIYMYIHHRLSEVLLCFNQYMYVFLLPQGFWIVLGSPGGHHWRGSRTEGRTASWFQGTCPVTAGWPPEYCPFHSVCQGDLCICACVCMVNEVCLFMKEKQLNVLLKLSSVCTLPS